MSAQRTLLAGLPEALRVQRERERLVLKTHRGPEGEHAADPFHSRDKLLGDVGSHSLVLELQLGVILRLQGLQNADDFTVLPRTATLLLVREFKPKKKKNSRWVSKSENKNKN